ncbi:MAG: DUF2505 family protein, partial [Actinobacteria bacterium]|nr:DUF2505 family protein [Actinomycetota bacterium]
MAGESRHEEPELLVLFAFQSRDEVARYILHTATLAINMEVVGMTTTMDFSQTYDFPPDAVREMISDPDFIAERATRTGSTSVDIEVTDEADGGTTVVVERVMPANVPSYAKSFVG